MPQKLVSIIIPTFNRASLVVEAIRSAQNQTYPAKQIIVVDDGSQDETSQIVAQFTEIEHYHQENKGQAAARNLGLSYAEGEYIASLDSDDIWYSDFLTEAVECIEKYNLDFVFLNWVSTDGEVNFIDSWKQQKRWQQLGLEREEGWFFLDSEHLRSIFLRGCPAPSSSLLIRRSSLASSWNEQMIMADDWLLSLDMIVTKPCRAAFTLTPHWIKRVFGDNIYDGRDMLEITKNALIDERLMLKHLNPHLNSAEKYIIRKRLANYCLNCEWLIWKTEGISKRTFSGIFTALTIAPMGISFQIIKIIINYIRCSIKNLLLPN